MTAWPFAPLVPLAYSLILADPPWSFRTYSAKGQRKSAQAHYACMSLADIKALPVGHLATPDAVLVMWATAPMIREALDLAQADPARRHRVRHRLQAAVGMRALAAGHHRESADIAVAPQSDRGRGERAFEEAGRGLRLG